MYGWCLLLLQIGTIAPDAFARSVSGTIGTDKAARSANGTIALDLLNGTIALDSFVRSANGTIALDMFNGTIASDRFERSTNDTNSSGNGTNSIGIGTTAIGNGTNAIGNGTNEIGNGTNASGNGSEVTFDVDKIIANVLRSSFNTFTKLITSTDIRQLCHVAKKVLKKKTTLAEIEPPIFLFGDVHGQYSDLLRMFNKIGYPTGDKKYMFIGDFVDRGKQSLEVAVLLMSYNVKYADTFVLLRGNHEVASANAQYGFKDGIEGRYGKAEGQGIYWSFNKAFALLPFAGLVGNKILCMHGGISPKILSLQQLRNLSRSIVKRMTDKTVENDLLWADPNESITGVVFNKARGTSVYFGMDVVDSILKRLDIDRIVRAHQVWPEGIKYFAGGRVISVFSAPRYQGKQNNTAVVLNVTADLNIIIGYTFEPNHGEPVTPNNVMGSATISPTTGGAPTNGMAYNPALCCWLEMACKSSTIKSAKLGGRFKVTDCEAVKKLKTADDPIILALGNEFVGSKDGIFLREYVP